MNSGDVCRCVDCFWLLSWILRKTVGREILRLVCGVRHSLGGARGLGVVIPDFEWHYFSLSVTWTRLAPPA